MPDATTKRARSGVHALKTLVSMRGLTRIDQRTLAGRDLIAWRQELITALGGKEMVSPQRAALVDAIVRTKLYLDCLDSWLLQQRSIVNARKRAVLPALRERTQLVDSLARLLSQLGLERQVKPVPTLAAFIADHDAQKEPEP